MKLRSVEVVYGEHDSSDCLVRYGSSCSGILIPCAAAKACICSSVIWLG